MARVAEEEFLKLYKIGKWTSTENMLGQVARKKGLIKAGGIANLDEAARSILRDYKNKIIVEELPVSDLTLSPDSIKSIAGGRKLSQTNRFCKCIKKVRKTFRNEKGPIAVCVKSVLWTRGRTLKRFKCGRNARVTTQKRK